MTSLAVKFTDENFKKIPFVCFQNKHQFPDRACDRFRTLVVSFITGLAVNFSEEKLSNKQCMLTESAQKSICPKRVVPLASFVQWCAIRLLIIFLYCVSFSASQMQA